MHQTEICRPRSSCWRWSGSTGAAQPAAFSLSQASYTGGRGGGGSAFRWLGHGAVRCLLPLLLPSNPPILVCQNTRVWHLGWQTELLSFQYCKQTGQTHVSLSPGNTPIHFSKLLFALKSTLRSLEPITKTCHIFSFNISWRLLIINSCS